MTIERLESALLKLPASERARLAERLIASLEEDSGIEAAWDEEIRRRVAELEQGAAETLSSAEVFAEARRRLKV